MDSITTDANLLGNVLGISDRRRAALESRLQAVGGLSGLVRAGSEALADTVPDRALERVGALLSLLERLGEPNTLPSPVSRAEDVVSYFSPRLAHLGVETVWVLGLDARSRPVGVWCVAQGTLTACLVHPREVFAPAIRARAAQIIVVHNHPSGDPAPSDEDHELTRRIGESGELLGIPLVDHVVVARAGFRSLGSLG
ncbi:MAG: JAB domain-containing protein [Deltaproteobacteria bacterium]|nr:JAB domain-containing protein [Deltaproteobacteria bacterium]